MFLAHGDNREGIDSKIIFDKDPSTNTSSIVELLDIAATYYRSRSICLDLNGFDLAPDDVLRILQAMDEHRQKRNIRFQTQTHKRIQFPTAYILFFGNVGERVLSTGGSIGRAQRRSLGFLPAASTAPHLSNQEIRMARMVSEHVKKNAYKRGSYTKILHNMTSSPNGLTANQAHSFRFIDTLCN